MRTVTESCCTHWFGDLRGLEKKKSNEKKWLICERRNRSHYRIIICVQTVSSGADGIVHGTRSRNDRATDDVDAPPRRIDSIGDAIFFFSDRTHVRTPLVLAVTTVAVVDSTTCARNNCLLTRQRLRRMNKTLMTDGARDYRRGVVGAGENFKVEITRTQNWFQRCV